MNVHFSYRHTVRSPEVEKIVNRHIEKLNKWLATFDPDLVHLHATLDYQNAREGFKSSLNLRLPVGQLFATEAGKTRGTLEEEAGAERAATRAARGRRSPEVSPS